MGVTIRVFFLLQRWEEGEREGEDRKGGRGTVERGGGEENIMNLPHC